MVPRMAWPYPEPMSDPFSRRDALRLASAVSALGIGLGASIDASAAVPVQTTQLKRTDIGTLSLKLYKVEGKTFTLLHAIDLTGLARSDIATVSMKLMNQRGDQELTLSEHKIAFTEFKR